MVKRKLGDHALCLLADMTALPIKDNAIDAYVSLNTVYHIPADEQITAIEEMNRSLKSKGKGIVVYEWFKHSLWMNMAMFPFRLWQFLSNRVKRVISKISPSRVEEKMLYYHAHPLKYLRRNLKTPFKLYVWHAVSVDFMKMYAHGRFGKWLMNQVYRLEENKPEKSGRLGEYPMLVFEK